MIDMDKFNEIFCKPSTPYQDGMCDRFNGKERQSNTPEYLQGYEAQTNQEQAMKAI
jgi:hypothetical protein